MSNEPYNPSYGFGEDFLEFIPKIPTLTYREIISNKINQITTVGFTIDEFQKAIVILCLVRFVIYSIKYNPITSFKICAIGSVSCLMWVMTLNDTIKYQYDNLDYCKILTRISKEEYEFREFAESMAQTKFTALEWKKATGEVSPYHFEWVKPIFDLLPKRYAHVTDPMYEYIRTDFYSLCRKIYGSHIRRQIPMVLYTWVVRIGKKYCPYHCRWHATFILLYGVFSGFTFGCCFRMRALMFKLLTLGRYEDADNIRLYLGAITFLQISFCMYAALHAIFSQYFYIPFIVQNTELHIGNRPTNSIYSGGYTAWQDAFVFYDLDFKASMQLWWGFLGRGTKKQQKKRKKRKKK